MSAPGEPGSAGVPPVLWPAGETHDLSQLGRLLSRVENDPAARAEVLAQLPSPPLPVQRIGITGSPGVGKSTLLARLIPLLQHGAGERAAGPLRADEPSASQFDRRIGVLAFDPTSAQTGGAVLADRFRWAELSSSGVFIRSLASRGSLGGVSAAASACARILEAAGYGPIVIETVGAGQLGFEVAGLADTVVVLLSPESGDSLQLLKAGLIEAGDIFAVNKSDRPGADAMAADLRAALELQREGAASGDWHPPVLKLSAISGEGVEELASSIQAHWSWLQSLPQDHPRRVRRLCGELEFALRAELQTVVNAVLSQQVHELALELQQGRLKLSQAIERLRSLVREGL